MPADQEFDVLGFALLDRIDEVETRIAEIADEYDLQSFDATRGLRDGRGNSITMGYGREMDVVDAKQGFDKLTIYYASNILGNRVQTVYRNVAFRDAEVSLPDLIASLEDKYGQPSLLFKESGSTKIAYIYMGGEQAFYEGDDFPKERYAREGAAREIASCLQTATLTGNGGRVAYQFESNRAPMSENCNGGIYATLREGQRPDLVSGMTTTVWDQDLVQANLFSQDQVLRDSLISQRDSVEGAAAPKL